MRRAYAFLALLLVLALVSCAVEPPEHEDDVISASVTECTEPDTTLPETVENVPIETEPEETVIPEPETSAPEETEPVETVPEETGFDTIVTKLPADLVFEISERFSEVYQSYTRKTLTVTEITQGQSVSRSEISSELMTNDGNAAFRRQSESGSEEYFLIDGFLCYGGKFGNYRFEGYDLASFSELAGNYFSLNAFEGGTVESLGDKIELKFDKLTEKGIADINEMLDLPEGYELSVTKAEFLYVTDNSANMLEKKLTIEASVLADGSEVLSFSLISHTEQTDINEPNDLALPAMTSYTLIRDTKALELYELALADINSFFDSYQAFELSEKDEISVGGALDLRITDKTDYAYAKKIGASLERSFEKGDSERMRVLTHFNHRFGFSQLNGGSIFVDSTINTKNLESTLTLPFSRAALSFAVFADIDTDESGRIIFTLNNEGKMMLIREMLLSSGINANSVTISSCDEAYAYIALTEDGKITSMGFEISVQVRADGKNYTLARTHTLEVTSRGSAKVKVIFIDVDEEEE